MLRLMTKMPKFKVPGRQDFVRRRRVHTLVAKRRYCSAKKRPITELCLSRMFDYVVKILRGPANLQTLLLRSALGWCSEKDWRTVQVAGTAMAPKRRKTDDGDYWRHDQVAKRRKRFEAPFVYTFGIDWISVLCQAEKHEMKNKKEEFIGASILSLGESQERFFSRS